MARILFVFAVIFGGLTFSFAQGPVLVTVDKASLRRTPDSKGAVIAIVKRDDVFDLIETKGTWSKVRSAKYTGWIEGKEISLPTLSNGPGSGGGMGMGTGSGRGVGVGSGSGSSAEDITLVPKKPDGPVKELRLLAKPRPGYTEVARVNQTQGNVILRVTFKADGTIGSVSVVKGLPDGLNGKAVDAARLIKFEPKTVNGVPQTVTKQVEYTFVIF